MLYYNNAMTEGTERPHGINLQYANLGELANEDLADLILCIEEELDCADTVEPFIDLSLELEVPGAINYTTALAQIIAGDRFDDEAARVAYRAFHFAHTIGSLLLSGPSGMKAEFFYGDAADTDELRDRLIGASMAYYATHSALDVVTSRFMAELDPGGRFGDVADTVAGTTFKFIEEAERQKAIDAEVIDFALELDGFMS